MKTKKIFKLIIVVLMFMFVSSGCSQQKSSKEKVSSNCIDEQHFEYLADNAHKKCNDKIYYKNNCDENIISGADIRTFTVLYDQSKYFLRGYAKDKNYVYYEGKILKDADVSTFGLVDAVYAKDKNYVYAYGRKIEDSDGRTFVYFNETNEGEDKNRVYNFLGESELKINKAYPGQEKYMGEFLVSILKYRWKKDKEYIYLRDEIIVGADPNTFKLIRDSNSDSTGYSKDKNNIYFLEKRIINVDKNSFRILQLGDYAVDKNKAYYNDKEVIGADIKTLEEVSVTCNPGHCYAKDKKNVYSFGEIIEGANPKTFEFDNSPCNFYF